MDASIRCAGHYPVWPVPYGLTRYRPMTMRACLSTGWRLSAGVPSGHSPYLVHVDALGHCDEPHAPSQIRRRRRINTGRGPKLSLFAACCDRRPHDRDDSDGHDLPVRIGTVHVRKFLDPVGSVVFVEHPDEVAAAVVGVVTGPGPENLLGFINPSAASKSANRRAASFHSCAFVRIQLSTSAQLFRLCRSQYVLKKARSLPAA